MGKKAKENRRKIALRQMLEVTSTTFSLSEEGKYDTETEYKLRNRYLFRKKKK